MEKTFPSMDKFLSMGMLPSPIDFQYYHLLNNKNTILINQSISDSLVEYAIIPLMELDKDPDVEHITILLNTIGGDVYTGFALISVLEQITTPTTLRIVGEAASMGILIAMAKNLCLHVICDKWSVGLLHLGDLIPEDDEEIDDAQWKFNSLYNEMVGEYVVSHTNMTFDYYQQIKDQEFWMNADTMKQLGIVDEII